MVAKKADGTCPKKDAKGRKIVEDKKTGRCRLVKKSASRSAKSSKSPSRSPCPPGSRRNRETGRCRKISASPIKRKISASPITRKTMLINNVVPNAPVLPIIRNDVIRRPGETDAAFNVRRSFSI
jgi:hypothetical protein